MDWRVPPGRTTQIRLRLEVNGAGDLLVNFIEKMRWFITDDIEKIIDVFDTPPECAVGRASVMGRCMFLDEPEIGL